MRHGAQLVVALTMLITAHPGDARAGGGLLDPSFGTNGIADVPTTTYGSLQGQVRITPSGMLIGMLGGPAPQRLYRAFLDGSLDPSFGTDGFVAVPDLSASSFDLGAVDDTGRMLLFGTKFDAQLSGDWIVVRLLASGTLDPSFGSGGVVTTNLGASDIALALVVQPDGKIVVGGRKFPDSALVRYNSDGSLDAGFGTGGVAVVDLGGIDAVIPQAIQDDGKILAGLGSSGPGFKVARFKTDGSLDTGFGTGGTAVVVVGDGSGTSLALQSDGKILLTGNSDADVSDRDFAVARLESDGTPDASFGSAGLVVTDFTGDTDESRRLVVQRDGRIVVIGVVQPASSTGQQIALARYDADGALDTSFGTSGLVVTPVEDASAPISALLLPDGDILVAGNTPNHARNFLLRYLACGPCDVTTAGGCVTAPLAGCIRTTVPRGAKLRITDRDHDASDALEFTLKKGGATTAADFGDPSADDGLVLCVSGVRSRTNILPGGQCGSAPCWRGRGDPPGSEGWTRSDTRGRSDGVVAVSLTPGPAGKAAVRVRAKGSGAKLPSLPLTLPVTARLQSASGQCWEAEFDAVVRRNVDGKFKGEGD
jgi:uncharacterized delta-60 repeat protein